MLIVKNARRVQPARAVEAAALHRERGQPRGPSLHRHQVTVLWAMIRIRNFNVRIRI